MSSVQKLSECRVLLYDSPEIAEGYGSVGIRLKALAENFFRAVNLCSFMQATPFRAANAVHAVLIVRGNRAIVSWREGEKWQAGLIMFRRTLPAVLFKRRCVNLGLTAQPHQIVPAQMRLEVAHKFVCSCPFLRVGDFVASACWGKAVVSNVSSEGPTFSPLYWEDSYNYPFVSPEN